MTPTLKNLNETFNLISNATYNGIKGVIKFDTNKKGPTLGITMQTHGDEPAGLAVLWNFLTSNLQTQLKNGSVIFILQNIEAARAYFSLLDDKSRNQYRYTVNGVNFNRLPEDSLQMEKRIAKGKKLPPLAYEITRLNELYPIYKEFTHGYDIHTSQDEVPMIIAGDKFYPELVKGFPIEIVLTNIAEAQLNLPSFSFFGGLNSNIPVFEIEAGTDESEKSFQVAIDCSTALLKNLKMIEGETTSAVKQYKEYFICDILVLENETFELVKFFEYYEPIKKGQELAKGIVNGKEKIIRASTDGHTIFPPLKMKKREHFSLSEETMFISKPIKTIKAK